MEKINFVNGTEPALNATNLNQLQTNLENAITETQTNLENAINGIIESGSNDNGKWIKYSDGTMICMKQTSLTVQCNKAWGALFESPQVSFGAMAQTFIEVPVIYKSDYGRSCFIEAIQGATTSNFGHTWLARPVADSEASNYIINLMAIGRWK